MVTEFGFSDVLGPLRYSDNQEEIFLGHSVTQQKHVSDATARLIDEEVRRLIDEAEATARRILSERRDDLETVAAALLEYETLSGEEVRALLRGETCAGRSARRAARSRPPQRRSRPAASGGQGAARRPRTGAAAEQLTG